jgi:hypothetical protein
MALSIPSGWAHRARPPSNRLLGYPGSDTKALIIAYKVSIVKANLGWFALPGARKLIS